MILLVAVLLIVATVPLAGRDLLGLRLPLRGVPMVVSAIVLQILVVNVVEGAIPHWLGRALHLASYALAAWFVVLNRRVRGLWLVALGGAMNLAAIAANHGVMPASPAALRAAGRTAASSDFTNSTSVRSARLAFLGDSFAVPKGVPLANVFSPGDVVLLAGTAVVLHRASPRRRGRAVESARSGVPPFDRDTS